MDMLKADRVVLGVKLANNAEAIRLAGEVLVKAGCVAPAYIDGMLARERAHSTYLGSGVAIPHGERADLRFVFQTGVSVVQVPNGVEWEPGESVYLVIGLASNDDQHTGVMVNLVELLQAPDEIRLLIDTVDPMVIVERLTRGRSENNGIRAKQCTTSRQGNQQNGGHPGGRGPAGEQPVHAAGLC